VNEDGLAVTPAGRPLTLSAVLAEKLPLAAMDAVTDAADAPGVIVRVEGETLRVKSAATTGCEVGGCVVPELQPPRYAMVTKRHSKPRETLGEVCMRALVLVCSWAI